MVVIDIPLFWVRRLRRGDLAVSQQLVCAWLGCWRVLSQTVPVASMQPAVRAYVSS